MRTSLLEDFEMTDEERKKRRIEAQRKYRETHREIIGERQRKWIAKNRDKVRESNRRYVESHKDIVKEIQKKWRKEHPDLVKTYGHSDAVLKSRRAYKKDYYKRTVNAKHSKMLWSLEDIELVLKHEIPDTELSKILGRSVAAIQIMRCKMKKREGEGVILMEEKE